MYKVRKIPCCHTCSRPTEVPNYALFISQGFQDDTVYINFIERLITVDVEDMIYCKVVIFTDSVEQYGN